MPDYYSPGPVAKAFRKSKARRRVITGPFGSGKSVACVIDIMSRIETQAPNKDNVRRSRWAIIRNTYPDLKNTTVRTWKDWVSEETYGQFINVAPFEHKLRYDLSDGTSVEADVIFLAMDKSADVKKFLSLELTGIYFNEVRELHRDVVEAGDGRIGRFPSMRDGGPTWHGMMADTNMPDEDHWLHELAENKTDGWEFFHQPGGVMDVQDYKANPKGKPIWQHNPNAENLKNIVPGYYTNQLAGKSDPWIKVYLAAQYGSLPEEGSFWSTYMTDAENEGRICNVPWQRHRPVDTWWDLGRSDDTAVWFIQTIMGEVHVIDYHDSFGKDVPFYAKMLQEKPYTYGKHHLPHDAKSETLAAGGRSILEQMGSLVGIDKVQLHMERDPQDRIQAARSVFDRCWFNKETTKAGRKHLSRYRREYDENLGRYKDKPRHDSASHAADAWGLFAYNYLDANPHLPRDPVMRAPTLNEAWDRQSMMGEARI